MEGVRTVGRERDAVAPIGGEHAQEEARRLPSPEKTDGEHTTHMARVLTLPLVHAPCDAG
ncbi:hypothetical protein [Streptomyces sp. NPDC056464]|uniref:hypothetical protein n=1 Tax=Streptomyces sp. NPDC056464 TaxID=3345828 RepID=UPI00369B768C